MYVKYQIYRQLQKHLDKMPVGFPSVKSGLEISVLRHLFTRKEAAIVLNLSHKPQTVKQIAAAGKDARVEELKKTLDKMAKKGLILTSEKAGETLYRCGAMTLGGGIISLQVGRLTADFINDYAQYLDEVNKATNYKARTPLRTIPVLAGLPKKLLAALEPADNIDTILSKAPGPYAVTNCFCRTAKDTVDEKCAKSALRETCVIIDPDRAKQAVAMGIGRFVTREQIYYIFTKGRRLGQTLQIDVAASPATICCCCGDCCFILSRQLQSPKPIAHFNSSYFVTFDPSRCSWCRDCVDKCPTSAITKILGDATTDKKLCIGCGNCVVACASDARKLIKKKDKAEK